VEGGGYSEMIAPWCFDDGDVVRQQCAIQGTYATSAVRSANAGQFIRRCRDSADRGEDWDRAHESTNTSLQEHAEERIRLEDWFTDIRGMEVMEPAS
jgi:hypothetical protein